MKHYKLKQFIMKGIYGQSVGMEIINLCYNYMKREPLPIFIDFVKTPQKTWPEFFK